MKLEIDWLRDNCYAIHNFGLGFVQLKIDKQTRLHFYKPSITNPIISDSEFHNHRYDFISHVLKGAIKNELAYHYMSYNDSSLNDYGVARVSCDPQNPIKLDRNSNKVYNVATWLAKGKDGEQIIKAGDHYQMVHTRFHKVSAAQPTITYVLRSGYKKEYAEVLRPYGSEPVCPFNNPLSEEECWEIVESML